MADKSLAAVDLGSNSFHMLVARQADGALTIVDKLKERVALAEGLDDSRRLSKEAMERGLACLERFGQRIKHLPHENVRVVGTNTLRQAKNGADFMERAEAALGHPVEVISGLEEARLVYSGVAHSEQMSEGRRLVVDIGGGSTECVIGENYDVITADSLYMGCISFTRRFFDTGKVSAKRMNRAVTAANGEMQTLVRRFKSIGFTAALGSSGTNLAIDRILRENGKSVGGITPDGLTWLREQLIAAGRLEKISLKGLEPERASVIPGGVAVLSGVFQSLGIERMQPSTGALREGLLFDLVGRIDHQDVREQTVRRLVERFAVDQAHGARVERTTMQLFLQVAGAWELNDDDRQRLAWAARLHEIGLFMQYSGYHKHGAYLVANTDMPGFSRNEQLILAALIKSHRRKLKRSWFKDLGPEGEKAFRLALLLRLATDLNRGRQPDGAPEVVLAAEDDTVTLEFPKGWVESSPLSQVDLDAERDCLDTVGITLNVV